MKVHTCIMLTFDLSFLCMHTTINFITGAQILHFFHRKICPTFEKFVRDLKIWQNNHLFAAYIENISAKAVKESMT